MKTQILLTVAAMTIIGCTRHVNGEITPASSVRISITGDEEPATKITGITGESSISNTKVFVFGKDGGYIASYESTGNEISAELFPGQYTLAAVTNSESVSCDNFTDIGGLEKHIIELSENGNGNLVMFGTKDIAVGKGNQSETIQVNRLVARISVRQIVNNISDPLYKSESLLIRRIFLSNVQGCARLDGGTDNSVWYNRNGVWSDESSDIMTLLEDKDINHPVVNGDSYNTEHGFYAFANHVSTDSFDETWSPRYTRLVIEAALGNEICYYIVPVPDITANHTYTVNKLTITKKGTDNPWTECDPDTFGAALSVSEWEVGLTEDVTI